MKISNIRYDALLKAEAQKETLKREMQFSAKNGTCWISFELLKTIFDLWDDIPQVKSPEDKDV